MIIHNDYLAVTSILLSPGKGAFLIPVAASAVDTGGHCVYPSPVILPTAAKKRRFTAVAADTGLFAALDDKGMLFYHR